MPLVLRSLEELHPSFNETQPLTELNSPSRLFDIINSEGKSKPIIIKPDAIRDAIEGYLEKRRKGFVDSAQSGDVYLGLFPPERPPAPAPRPDTRLIFSGPNPQDVVATANRIAAELESYQPDAFSDKTLLVPITLEIPQQQKINELIKALCDLYFPEAMKQHGLPLDVKVVLQPLTFAFVAEHLSEENWSSVQSDIIQSATDAGRFKFDEKGRVTKTLALPKHFTETRLPGFKKLGDAKTQEGFKRALIALNGEPLFFPDHFLSQSQAIATIYDQLRRPQLVATTLPKSQQAGGVKIWSDDDQLFIKADPSFNLGKAKLFIVNPDGYRYPLTLTLAGGRYRIDYGEEGKLHSISELLHEMKSAFRIETKEGKELCTVYRLMSGQNIDHEFSGRKGSPRSSEDKDRYLQRHIRENSSEIANGVRQAVRDFDVGFARGFKLRPEALQPLLDVLRISGPAEWKEMHETFVALGGSSRAHFLPATGTTEQPGSPEFSPCAPVEELMSRVQAIFKQKRASFDSDLVFNTIVSEVRRLDSERIWKEMTKLAGGQ